MWVVSGFVDFSGQLGLYSKSDETDCETSLKVTWMFSMGWLVYGLRLFPVLRIVSCILDFVLKSKSY